MMSQDNTNASPNPGPERFGAEALQRLQDIAVNEAGELFDRDGVLEASFETYAAYCSRDKARYERRAQRLRGELPDIAGSYLWITDRLSHFYYHWFCDALPRLEAALGAETSTYTLLLPRRVLEQQFVRESLKAWPEITVAIAAGVPGVRVSELRVPPRAAETPDVNGSLLRRVAGRICRHFPGAGSRRIFVSREGARIRRLENEKEIGVILAAHGFEIVAMEQMAFAEQVTLMQETRLLAGGHGGGLTNMLFMPVRGLVLELRAGEEPPPCFRNMAVALGHEWRGLSCRATDQSMHPHAADIVADPLALEAALGNIFSE
jgi:capsular polysaccharide biosynthesis protein